MKGHSSEDFICCVDLDQSKNWPRTHSILLMVAKRTK